MCSTSGYSVIVTSTPAARADAARRTLSSWHTSRPAACTSSGGRPARSRYTGEWRGSYGSTPPVDSSVADSTSTSSRRMSKPLRTGSSSDGVLSAMSAHSELSIPHAGIGMPAVAGVGHQRDGQRAAGRVAGDGDPRRRDTRRVR